MLVPAAYLFTTLMAELALAALAYAVFAVLSSMMLSSGGQQLALYSLFFAVMWCFEKATHELFSVIGISLCTLLFEAVYGFSFGLCALSVGFYFLAFRSYCYHYIYQQVPELLVLSVYILGSYVVIELGARLLTVPELLAMRFFG